MDVAAGGVPSRENRPFRSRSAAGLVALRALSAGILQPLTLRRWTDKPQGGNEPLWGANWLTKHVDAFSYFLRHLPSDVERLKLLAAETHSSLARLASWQRLGPFRRIYVPSLRTLRTLPGNQLTPGGRSQRHIPRGSEIGILERSIWEDNFPKLDPDKETSPYRMVFSGEFLVEHVLWDQQNDLEGLADFESFMSRECFDGAKVQLRAHGGHLAFRVGTDTERPLHSLGDGLQQLILLTYLTFHHYPSLFFIEEPEQCLHPGLQRVLFRLLASGPQSEKEPFQRDWAETNHHFFVSTQSNHFLDLTFDYKDVTVFRVSKQSPSKCVVEMVSGPNGRLMEDLGARSSSTLLVNATIWVEGHTDRHYLLHYLDLFQQHLRTNDPNALLFSEGKHFVIAEYAGANITHWDFSDHSAHTSDQIRARRLCSSCMVVADRDHNKSERHKALRALLGTRYYVLPVREIENLLPSDVLRQLVAAKLSVNPKHVKKPVYRDYKDEPIGSYLEGLNPAAAGRFAAPLRTAERK